MKRVLVLLSALVLSATGGLPALAAPPAPTRVVVVSNSAPSTAVASASLTVTWDRADGAVSYSVSAVDAVNNAKTALGTCTSTTCSAIVAGLTGGTTYSVKVTAVANDGSTTPSAVVQATAVSVPGAPSALTATSTAGQAALTWVASENRGGLPLLSYKITEKDNKVAPVTVSAATTNLNVDSVTVGQSYVFRVSAVNSNGTSVVDDFTSVTITGAPSAPTAPTVTVLGSTLTVAWTAPADQGSEITGYSVYLVDNNGIDEGLPTLTSATQVSIVNVAAGTYRVQVVAKNINGDSLRSPFSDTKTVGTGTQDNTPIFTPSNVTSMDIGTTQSLSVVSVSGGDVAIEVTASPDGACTYSAGVISAVSSGTCTISATAAGNSTYAVGQGSRVVTVKSRQSIVFGSITQQSMPGPFTLSATATSGLSVRYVATGNCTVSSRTVTFISAGTCNIMASQPGNSAFSAAVSVPQSFTIVAGGISAGGGTDAGEGSGINPRPTPKPTTPTAPKLPKLADSATISNSLLNATVVTIKGTKLTTAIKLGKTVAVKLTSIPVKTKVTSTLKNAKGQTFALPTKTVGANKIYSSVAVKPKAKGTYTITVSYGKVKKTLILVVR